MQDLLVYTIFGGELNFGGWAFVEILADLNLAIQYRIILYASKKILVDFNLVAVKAEHQTAKFN